VLPEPVPPEPVPPGSGAQAILGAPVSFTVLSDSIPADPQLAELVAPFREAMAERISEVVGEAAGPMEEGHPEGPLGNFAADAILWAARSRAAGQVHFAVTNNGGLRIPLAQGPITVGTMFELMPFENLISILTLTGRQVEELALWMAGRGGEPVADLSFSIVGEGEARAARNIRIGGEPLDLEGIYRVATNDYLANGGDDQEIFLSAQEREDLPLLVRDALIEYLREIRVIDYRVEGRITRGGRP
jgi:2',3'-cyclic-nucleotide 2'-phosphodiesterase (5'-nucleotidase family)